MRSRDETEKRKNTSMYIQPVVVAVCTSIMARAHEMLRQAGGIPLGLFITSDESKPP